MKRTAAILASAALALSLAACGGSSSDDSPSSDPLVSPERLALIDEMRAEGEASGASAEEISCVIQAIEQLSVADLESVKNGTQTEETQAVMTAASEKCLAVASPAAS